LGLTIINVYVFIMVNHFIILMLPEQTRYEAFLL